MKDKNFNLGEKELYQLFNEVKIEESEFTALNEEMPAIQKERIKKNLSRRIQKRQSLRIFKYGSAAAAAGLAFLIGIGTLSPAFAADIPVLNSITQTLNDKFGFHGNYTEYSQMINKSATDQGITITINEALADDSKLILGYTIKSDKKMEDLEISGLQHFLRINGRPVAGGGTGMGNYLDDYTYVGSDEIHTALPANADNFNVDIRVDKIMGIKGQWNLAFSVSKEALSKQSTVFNPNTAIVFPNSKVTIDKVVFSPIDTTIFAEGNYTETTGQREGLLFDYDYWLAFDDKGVELIPKSLGGGSSDSTTQTFRCEMNYQSLDRIPKFLTIIPCKVIPSGGGGVSIDENGKETPLRIETKQPEEISKIITGVYPLELPQGKFGKLIVREIKTENNTTTIHFTTEGKAPYFQATGLHLKDNKGELLVPKNYALRKDEQKPNEFTMSFDALDPSREYYVTTTSLDNVELREDLKFKIELNNLN